MSDAIAHDESREFMRAVMNKSDPKIIEVIEYVEAERKRRGIGRVDRQYKRELSGIMQGPNGDIISLIEQQLLQTEFGYAAWNELSDANILDAVISEIRLLRK